MINWLSDLAANIENKFSVYVQILPGQGNVNNDLKPNNSMYKKARFQTSASQTTFIDR